MTTDRTRWQEWLLHMQLRWNRIRYRKRQDARSFSTSGGGWGSHFSARDPDVPWFDRKKKYYGHSTPRPRVGDEVLSPMRSGKTLIGVVQEVELCRDPGDMFFARVAWHGYTPHDD